MAGLVRGAATKYREEYCQLIIDRAREGWTIEKFADSINVHRDTVYQWVKVFPEFKEAFAIARQAHEVKMQELGLLGMSGQIKGFNALAWIFWCRTRLGYSDNAQVGYVEPIDELEFNEE